MSKKDLRWPVGIIIVFSLFFIALLVFLLLALRSRDSLVERDYYRKSIAYQQHINRINRTKENGKDIVLSYDNASGQLVISYPDSTVTGDIFLYRPDDMTVDRLFSIIPDDSLRQTLDLSRLKKGLWKVKINWNVGDSSYFREKVIILATTNSQTE